MAERPRVLLLDPDPRGGAAVVRALDAAGIAVDHARTRPEAFARLGSAQYAAVLSIDERPALDGVELLLAADTVAPDAIKVLLVPDYAADDELAGRGGGRFLRFVTRPFDPRNLVALLGEALKLERLVREQRGLLQRVGLEYQKLQRREKLLDVVVRERTREIEVAYAKLKAANRQALLGLAEAIEAKDPYTKGHCGRVAAYALALARECGYPAEGLEMLEFGSFLHDIGKIGVRDAVLLKPGPLDDDEWAHMKMHPVKGYEIASQIDMLRPAVPCVRNHHERWDGKGYPDGLRGEQIPLAARIVAIADAFDAMATDRPYKRAMTAAECCAAFRRVAGTQYDPGLIEVFVTGKIAERFLEEDPGSLSAS